MSRGLKERLPARLSRHPPPFTPPAAAGRPPMRNAQAGRLLNPPRRNHPGLLRVSPDGGTPGAAHRRSSSGLPHDSGLFPAPRLVRRLRVPSRVVGRPRDAFPGVSETARGTTPPRRSDDVDRKSPPNLPLMAVVRPLALRALRRTWDPFFGTRHLVFLAATRLLRASPAQTENNL